MRIEPLSEKTLDDAIILLIKIFGSSPSDFDYAGKWLPLSLKDKVYERVDEENICTYVKYYVGVDEKNGKVVGVTGIYTLNVDEKDSAWVAWFCLAKKYRGKGYGGRLLDFVIDIARKMNKKYLKVYTSYETDIEKAMELYKNRGFYVTKKEKHPQTGEELIYLQRDLK